MIQITAATFEDGVFKPDQRLDLPLHARVRLVVEPLPEDTATLNSQQAWKAVEQLWKESNLDS
jgi:predicted DNA-binding antitoxin AbrB/MazE fold protein